MLFSVEQAFVGREEIRAPLKRPAWEAKSVRAGDESELPTRGSIYNTLPGKVVMQNGRETINKATEGIIIKRVIKGTQSADAHVHL